jgi:hypothetical protein
MKMVPNTDIYTNQYLKTGWASIGFDFTDSFDGDVESADTFGNKSDGGMNFTY